MIYTLILIENLFDRIIVVEKKKSRLIPNLRVIIPLMLNNVTGWKMWESNNVSLSISLLE